MKRFLYLLTALLLASCTPAPKAEHGVPLLVDTNVAADAVSASLTATFDHAGNIKEAGFELAEAGGGDSRRSSVVPAGNTLSTTFDGLRPDTEYSYLVFWTNGRTEDRSEGRSFRTAAASETPHDPGRTVDPAQFNANLYKYLLQNFDADGDGLLSEGELAAVEELNLSSLLLEDHRGLETLANLRSVSFGYNWLPRIDVSANKKLEFLSAGGDPHLQEIILDNPELVQTYFVGDSGVRHLDFTRCPRIYICEWWDFPVETVDFSGCEELFAVRIGGTLLRELDLSDAWRLCHLNSVDNPCLETIWLKEGVTLESLEYDPHTKILYK